MKISRKRAERPAPKTKAPIPQSRTSSIPGAADPENRPPVKDEQPIPAPKPEKIASDYPEYIDPKTGKFKKGYSGNPSGCPKGIIYKSARIKNALLSFFEENYLNTGNFMQWVRTSNNEQAFFDYMIKHVLPKDVNTKMELTTGDALAEKIKEARDRAKKKDGGGAGPKNRK